MENIFRNIYGNLWRTIVLVGVLCVFPTLVHAQHPLKRPEVKKVQTQSKPQHRTKQPTEGWEQNYQWVDLGLRVRWATRNLGASSNEGFGDFFCWGNIKKSSIYNERYCEHYKNPVNQSIQGISEYDAARVRMGGKWRLPTVQDFRDLLTKCTWVWCSSGASTYGYKVTGPNGKSIFLPAQGYSLDKYDLDINNEGYYWTATSGEKRLAYALYFNRQIKRLSYCDRSVGRCIRAVLDKR